MVLFAVEASAGSSGRPCGVYMFSGLPTLVINIYNITIFNVCYCVAHGLRYLRDRDLGLWWRCLK